MFSELLTTSAESGHLYSEQSFIDLKSIVQIYSRKFPGALLSSLWQHIQT